MKQPEEMTIANLDGGGLMELATREFHKICDNVADPNVRTDATRKLTINIEVKPDRKGQTADVAYSVKSTLVGPDKAKTTAFIAQAPGSQDISLFGVDVRQGDLFPEGEEQGGPVAVPSKAVNQ
jgi:hypothetical protein